MKIEIYTGFKEYTWREDVFLRKGQKLRFVKGKKRIGSIIHMGPGRLTCRLFGANERTRLKPQRYHPRIENSSCMIEERVVEFYRTKKGPKLVSVFIDGRKYKYLIQKWRK